VETRGPGAIDVFPRFEVDGARLLYREVGDGSPVLLIHGGGTTSGLWGECLDRIAEFARAIAYDQRAFGGSSGEPAAGVARHGDDAARIIEGLEAAPATVLGHSFGATIALDLATRYPALVRSLVLVEPALDLGPLPPPGMLSVLPRIQLRRVLFGEREAVRWFFRWATSRRSGGNGFEDLPADLQEVCLANAAPLITSWRYSSEASGRHLPKPGISSIRCPTILITGTESQHDFRRTTRRVARAIRQARLIEVPGACHLVHYDDADPVVQAVREAVALPAR
jgi:pimeloyl-ACP methyl ester carboxylesterase